MRLLTLYSLAAALLLCACPEPPPPSNGTNGSNGSTEAAWNVVAEGLPGALFAVRGTSADDVWIVGADRGGDEGPTAMQWDGESWTHHDTGLTNADLYWVHPFSDGPTYLAGTGGQILQYDGEFTAMTTPSEQDVWGLWGSAPDDLWAVGGDSSGAGTGFIWRYDGDTWTRVDAPDLPATGAWFKAWGSSADDVYFCGMDGALAHYDGTEFTAIDAGTTRTLLTVNGRDDGSIVTAVGGQFSATLVESSGERWDDVTPSPEPLQTFGVHHRGDSARAVGMQGLVLTREDDTWVADETHIKLREDLHGVWIDPDGGIWGVGGRIISRPLIDGTLVYHGTTPPASP